MAAATSSRGWQILRAGFVLLFFIFGLPALTRGSYLLFTIMAVGAVCMAYSGLLAYRARPDRR